MSGRSPARRSLGWIVLGALCLALLAVATFGSRSSNDPDAQFLAVSQRFACPVCNGQSIAESDSTIAREIRKEIRTRLDQGQTEQQITDYLVGAFGENIDLRPKATGVTGLVWILPVAGFVCAVAGLVVVFRRWRSVPVEHESDDDRALVAAARAHPGGPASGPAPGADTGTGA